MARAATPAVAGDHPSIFSICVSGFPGTNRALTTLAGVTGAVRPLVLADAKPGGHQTRFIKAHLDAVRPRTVILGGWSEHYEPFLERARSDGPQWVVYWTSSPGQTGMAGEIDAYLRILDDRRIAAVLYADVSFAHAPAARLKKSAYLPVCMPPFAPVTARAAERREGPTVLSLFFSAREAPRKNAVNALLALVGMKDDYVLHLNGLSQHASYRRLLRKLDIPCRDLGWMERDAYERALDDVDLGLQVSFAESYNQVVADHFVRGIPVVVSEMTPVLRHVDPALRAKVVVANADDPAALRAAIVRLVSRPRERARIGAAICRQLSLDNTANIQIAARVLRRLG